MNHHFIVVAMPNFTGDKKTMQEKKKGRRVNSVQEMIDWIGKGGLYKKMSEGAKF